MTRYDWDILKYDKIWLHMTRSSEIIEWDIVNKYD